MNPLVHFQWYRRWRGGVWGHHSALFHPWGTWTRMEHMPADFSAKLGDEDHRTDKDIQLGRVLINGHAYIRPIVRVAHVTFDGSTMIIRADELLDHIGDDDANTYSVRFCNMRLSKFEALPEFSGW